MAYVRSNKDWYMNQGMSERQARKQCRIDKLMQNVDPGFCNPYKIKYYNECLEEATEKASRYDDEYDDD